MTVAIPSCDIQLMGELNEVDDGMELLVIKGGIKYGTYHGILYTRSTRAVLTIPADLLE